MKHILTLTAALATLLVGVAPASAQDRTVAIKKDGATRIAERDLRELKQLIPGIYTNEEQVYFQNNLDFPQADRVPRVEVVIKRVGDSFESILTRSTGERVEARHDYSIENGAILSTALRFGRVDCVRTMQREFDAFRGDGCGGSVILSPDGLRMVDGGQAIHMLRARTFKCWLSPQKSDGEYAFYNDLVLHDQGGRIWIEATSEHPRVGLKMRNVRWPTGVNRDSLVLYTYRGDDEDYAPAYTWADPDAERLAINTRWLQASCTAGNASYTPNINLKTGSGN